MTIIYRVHVDYMLLAFRYLLQCAGEQLWLPQGGDTWLYSDVTRRVAELTGFQHSLDVRHVRCRGG